MKLPGRWPASGGIFLTAAGSLLAVAIAAFLLLGTLAARKASVARQGWELTLGSWDQILKRYPWTEANADALELERLTLALGIDIAPADHRGS